MTHSSSNQTSFSSRYFWWREIPTSVREKTVYSFFYGCDTKKLILYASYYESQSGLDGFFSRLIFFWILRSKWVKRNRRSIGQEDRAVQVAQEMVTNVTH